MHGRRTGKTLALIGPWVFLAATGVAQETGSPPGTSTTAPLIDRTPATATAIPMGQAGLPAVTGSSLVHETGYAGAAPLPATAPTGPDYRRLFRPVFQPPVLVWFGGLLWLILAIDFRRFWSLRTVDVLVIVAICILFQFRGDDRRITGGNADVSYAFVAWTGIFVVSAYLFLRAISRLLHRAARETPGPAIGAATWVFLAFVASMNLCSVPVANVGDSGICATRDAEYLRTTGQMPYGQLSPCGGGMDGPLMYALQAALLKPAADTSAVVSQKTTLTPAEPQTTRWISGIAEMALLLGIIVLGWQQHSATMGALLAALYGILPPVVTELAAADATVPAALVIWAMIAATPRAKSAGAVVSGALLAVASGVMFYPALLAPAWFGYFLRRRRADSAGEHAVQPGPLSEPMEAALMTPRPQRRPRDFGAVAFVASFVVVVGLTKAYAFQKTVPAPPRTEGILAVIGEHASVGTHELTIRNGEWALSPIVGTTQLSPATSEDFVTSGLQWLADDGSAGHAPVLSSQLVQQVPKETWAKNHVPPPPAAWPPGRADVRLREIRPGNAEAARALNVLYTQAVSEYPWWRRAFASGRTIFEATCLRELDPRANTAAASEGERSALAAASAVGESSAWTEWEKGHRNVLQGPDAGLTARSHARTTITEIRRAHRYAIGTLLAVSLAVFLALAVFKSRCTLWHVCAVSAALTVGAELCRVHGGGSDVAWYLPLVIVALFAGRTARASAPPHTAATQPAPTFDQSPYPFSEPPAG
jgi:hypothetical protein